MKANKVINDYSKYQKVPTTIKGDLLLDDNFLSNHQSTKDQQHINIAKETVSIKNQIFTCLSLTTPRAIIIIIILHQEHR